jgi:hypothetical protein
MRSNVTRYDPFIKSQRVGLEEQPTGGPDFKNNSIEIDDMSSTRYSLKKKLLTTCHLVFPKFQPLWG